MAHQAIAAIEAACIVKRPEGARAHVETGVAAIDATLGGGLMLELLVPIVTNLRSGEGLKDVEAFLLRQLPKTGF